MQNYIIKKYQAGFEHDQARIGIEVARNWIWPYAYDLADLENAHSQPDFDPDSLHFCFLGDEMVGYLSAIITRKEEDGDFTAQIDFPRMLPGHEPAAEFLMESGFKMLKIKGVSQVTGRVTTMCPGDIQLGEKMGFNIHDWGYKVYYIYKMEWGNLNLPEPEAEDINSKKGLNESASIATHWYKQSQDWCLSLLEEWHKAGVVADLGVFESGKMVAGCMVAPNPIRPSTAAIYYIYTPNERCLRSLLPKVISKCIDFGSQNVIADLINEHRQYEPLYQGLGFKKSAEWARCEKELM